MTRRTNARIAGITFLLYIAAGLSSMALRGRAPATEVLPLITSFCALVLGVTLYALTRDEDRDLAVLALVCRVVESIPGNRSEVFFAAGSTIFCWLLLRGRTIPVALAWLGVVSSALLLMILLLQRGGLLGGVLGWSSSITWMIWMPMLVFELALAGWLIAKGVAPRPVRQPA
jgi:hypothetical protein